MKKAIYKGFYGACAAVLLLAAGACNSSENYGQEGTADYSGTAVKRFSLKEMTRCSIISIRSFSP